MKQDWKGDLQTDWRESGGRGRGEEGGQGQPTFQAGGNCTCKACVTKRHELLHCGWSPSPGAGRRERRLEQYRRHSGAQGLRVNCLRPLSLTHHLLLLARYRAPATGRGRPERGRRCVRAAHSSLSIAQYGPMLFHTHKNCFLVVKLTILIVDILKIF